MTEERSERLGTRGLRRTAMAELALFFLLALAADRFLFHADRFWGVEPHPFWIPVLLLSAQYGTAEGLVAAAVSSVALLALNLPSFPLSQDRYDVLVDLVRRPLMWFAAAAVLGEVRRRHALREAALRTRLAESDQREASLRHAADRLAAARDRLETAAARQRDTVLGVCRAGSRLALADAPEVLAAAMDMVRAALHPEKFSLFLVEDGGLRLAAQEGWTESDRWLRALPADSPLGRTMLRGRNAICVAHPGDESVLSGEGIAAAPLRDAASGEAIGMLKIEAWDLADLCATRLQTLQTLAEWIAAACMRAGCPAPPANAAAATQTAREVRSHG